ncbi:MAG: hypothetical protein ACJAT2_003579 [Bacteriovoracaceae bacterium]|jgi:hypothetical protein
MANLYFSDKLQDHENSGFYAHYFNEDILATNKKLLSLKQIISENSSKWTNEFLDWHKELCRLGSENVEDWWLLPASRAIAFELPLLENLFFSLALIEKVEKENIDSLEVIGVPIEVFDFIKELKPEWSLKTSVSSKKNSPVVKLLDKLRSVKFLSFILLRSFLNSVKWDLAKPKGGVLLYSHLIHSTIFKASGDHFFGNMFKNLERDFPVQWLFLSSLKKTSEASKLVRELNSNGSSCYLIQNLINLKHIGLFYKSLFRISKQLKNIENCLPSLKINKHYSTRFPMLFFNHLAMEYKPFVELEVYFSFKIYLTNSPVEIIIYPYEEKGLERAILKAAKGAEQAVLTMGYAHALHNDGHLYLSKKHYQNINIPQPDYIATTGPSSRKWLSEKGFDNAEMIDLGTKRYREDLGDIPKFFSDRENCKKLKILFICGLVTEASSFYNLIKDRPETFKDCELVIRIYPFSHQTLQNNYLGKIRKILPQLQTDIGTLEQQVKKSDVVLFYSTSAGLEAILGGRLSVYLNLDSYFNLNPIDGKGEFPKRLVCENLQKLEETIQYISKLTTEEYTVLMKEQRVFAKNIYSPPEMKELRKLLNSHS